MYMKNINIQNVFTVDMSTSNLYINISDGRPLYKIILSSKKELGRPTSQTEADDA